MDKLYRCKNCSNAVIESGQRPDKCPACGMTREEYGKHPQDMLFAWKTLDQLE